MLFHFRRIFIRFTFFKIIFASYMFKLLLFCLTSTPITSVLTLCAQTREMIATLDYGKNMLVSNISSRCDNLCTRHLLPNFIYFVDSVTGKNTSYFGRL